MAPVGHWLERAFPGEDSNGELGNLQSREDTSALGPSFRYPCYHGDSGRGDRPRHLAHRARCRLSPTVLSLGDSYFLFVVALTTLSSYMRSACLYNPFGGSSVSLHHNSVVYPDGEHPLRWTSLVQVIQSCRRRGWVVDSSVLGIIEHRPSRFTMTRWKHYEYVTMKKIRDM